MNPPCARCKKTVYPVEKLNCLDKIWHKGCFKCETCGLTLNMKNYKGYNKLPYCNAHYPTTKFTAVADTPENKRLAKNTQQQSSVEYHKEFEESKGAYVAVADDRRAPGQPVQAHPAQQQSYQQDAPQHSYQQAPSQAPPQQHTQPPPQHVAPPAPASSGPRYVAIYDYNAADEDEVSFVEGDRIIEAEIIDEGWMQGKVERTGQCGMLPSNYVEESR